jgi:hypothetical protein
MRARVSAKRRGRRRQAADVISVQSGSVTTRICTQERNGRRYYTVAWHCAGKRERQHCATLDEARKLAKAQADRIAAGTAQSARISMVEAQNFREAQRHMVGLDIPLHAAAGEYASLRRALGERGTLQQAVEFFRLFPDAHDFRVTTATRMSASFPWVSPAINLPTQPPRRIVDAGYYDNYGVNLTALWLSKMSGWLRENTSGVVVVQVRDKVSQGARTEIDFDRLGGDDAPLDRLVWHGGSKVFRPGLQAITTPLIGITNARQWTMAFRNDEQVDLQDLLFDDEQGRDFFRTVVFECPVDVSLNWKLTEREKAILTGGFGRPDAAPREELSRIRDFMTGKDSYEFHKWRIDHRNDPTFERQLKARYDEQLRVLGVRGTERLTVRESQSLYENVVKNLKRPEMLADWWTTGRVAPP